MPEDQLHPIWRPRKYARKFEETLVRKPEENLPRVIHVTEDGTKVRMSNCPSEWYITPAGNVVQLVVETNQDLKHRDPSYRIRTLAQAKKDGWEPYYKEDDPEWEKTGRAAHIAKRQQIQAQKMNKYHEAFKSEVSKAVTSGNEITNELLTKLVDGLTKKK